MKNKFLKSIVTALSLLVFFSANAQTYKHHVVIQLTSNDTLVHKAIIKQIKNVLDGMDSVQIEVVCHSNGISLLLNGKTKFASDIQALKDKGVIFDACKNTMRERNLKPEDIVPMATFVPSGMIEVIKKQEAGWSYIKATL
jgi:intracellular sulfur oxidation DsrE/DsrF family protein